jgi:hypothetical protein
MAVALVHDTADADINALRIKAMETAAKISVTTE